MREMRGYRGNHQEKLALERISRAIQFTIPDTAGTNPDCVCNYTDTRSTQPNAASRTTEFSNMIIITSFTSAFPSSLFLVLNSTNIAEHKVKSSLSISPCHAHELTPSTAYTEYSIHARLLLLPSFE